MTNSEELVDVRCPVCNSIVFQYEKGSVGVIHEKCRRCKDVRPYVIPIKNS